MQAGSPAALATLWPVDDRAIFLLMLRFHREILLNPAITPARALRQAARWLRQASADEIKRAARDGLKGIRTARSGDTTSTSNDADVADDALVDEAAPAVRGVTALDETNTPDDAADVVRITAAEAIQHLSRLSSVSGSIRPYAHAIFWACAIVYGA